jgi:hypothetical protein
MILTEQDIEKALNRDYQNTVNELVESADLLLKGNRMLVENRLSKQEYQVLQEGAWESIKYGLAKLGRYKAGGKIFGKGKIDQEAGAKIQSILDKKGNEVIKKLNDIIKQENPEFPNNKEGEKFLKTVIEIATVYDSIIEATKKNPKEEGYLPTDAANSIIADLAEYVKKFLDVDLASAYTVMDSEEEKVDGEGDKELLADEVEDIKEDEAADTRAKLQAKAGDTKYDTKRMGKEGLKSNKLPMLLAGVGASLGAFSWLANTEWFKHLFEETFKYTDTEQIRDVIETKTQVLNDIKPGEGVYKLLGRVTEHPLDGNSNPSELVDALKQIGGGDAHKGVDLLCQDGGVMMKPGEAAKGLHDLVNNPDQYDKLGDMFKDTASGTGKLAEPGTGLNTTSYGTVAGKSLTSLLVKKLPIIITKVVTKTGIKMGAGYAVAKGLGAVLGPIGIGLVAAGALVKLMRVKGQKQSRAKTLNDLLQSLQPIKAEEASLPPVLPEPPNPVTGGGEGKGGKNVCNSKNLNEINKLLNKVKGDSQNFTIFKDYMKDDEFRDIFFSAIADVNQSIKINKQPLVKTLAALRSQGLIEAPTGRQRKYLKFKLDFQNFMTDVFKLFVMLNKNCKDSQTHKAIKEFYKQLYVIATQGKNAGVKSKVKFESLENNDNLLNEDANKDLRDKLFKKLAGNFSTFLNALNKLKPMEKGKEGKPSEKEIAKRKEAKKGKGGEKGTEGEFAGSAPRTKPPQLAHHDRGDNYLSEEITRIKRLMK